MRPGRIAVEVKKPTGVLGWVASGEPMIWANAAAVSLSLIGVVGLLLLLAVLFFVVAVVIVPTVVVVCYQIEC